jgi:hypothetical protein
MPMRLLIRSVSPGPRKCAPQLWSWCDTPLGKQKRSVEKRERSYSHSIVAGGLPEMS